jgi:hypothetical protein
VKKIPKTEAPEELSKSETEWSLAQPWSLEFKVPSKLVHRGLVHLPSPHLFAVEVLIVTLCEIAYLQMRICILPSSSYFIEFHTGYLLSSVI